MSVHAETPTLAPRPVRSPAGRHVLLFTLSLLSISCDPTSRYQLLSKVFDDVPLPGAVAPPRQPVRVRRVLAWSHEEPVEVAEDVDAIAEPVVEARPIEALRTWDEASKLIPNAVTGGPNWIAAVEQGVIRPRAFRDPEKRSPLPFPLDIEMDRDDGFDVLFPHFSHTLWLACTNCHPAIFEMKKGANDIKMADVFEGRFCGTCHGKVAFAPVGGCVRCHTRLSSVDPELVAPELATAVREPVASSKTLIAKGKVAYQKYCVMCHGEAGDGAGPAADGLNPRPRDFREGLYKFRTTEGGSLPTDADIFRTITVGVPGTSMPGWAVLPYERRWELVHYVKSFSERFGTEETGDSLTIPEPNLPTEAMIEEGKQLYSDAGCNACHGDKWDGNGPSADGLEDEWGYPIRPFAFASTKPLKSGPRLQDIYRTIMTGLNGTPMPTFGDVLEPDLTWPIVRYIETIREGAKREAEAEDDKAHIGIRRPSARAIAADVAAARADAIASTPELLELGALVYEQQCAVCHGLQGDGEGMAAANVTPKPRDFRQGTYKFRTTVGGNLPTDADIFRTITVGVPGTSMPGWGVLPYEERWALVHHLKTFSDRFAEEDPGELLVVPEPVPVTPQMLEEGAQLYVDAGCNACHGDGGWGDGQSAAGLEDEWGYPIRPYAFASGYPMKSGPALQDIYRTIMTGLNGTPMPTFGDALDPELAWPIVHYVRSLAPPSGALAKGAD